MTDKPEPTLSERLRAPVIIDEVHSDNALGREAADEIDRLGAALAEAEHKLMMADGTLMLERGVGIDTHATMVAVSKKAVARQIELEEQLIAASARIAELEGQIARTRKAVQFVKWAMQEGPWNGCELDGGEVQDKARDLGLLDCVPYDPEKHGESEFDIEPGDDWLVLKPEILALADEVGKP